MAASQALYQEYNMNKETNAFETIKKDLETGLKKLESDDLSLEDSLSQYEKAIAQSKKLHATLQRFESHYETLRKDADDLN